MATDHHLRSVPAVHDSLVPAAIAGALLISAGVVTAAVSGHFAIALALVALATVAVGAAIGGYRSFVHVFFAACALRPLVDLTAGPRDSGIALTEVYGVVVLGAMALWLAVHWAPLRPRLARPLPLTLIALVLVQAFAAAGSTDPFDGMATTLRLAAGVAAFLVTDLLLATQRISLRGAVGIVLGVSVVPLLYPLLGFVGVQVTHNKDDVTALKSVFYLSNNFAYFLVPLLVLGVAWALRSQGWVRVAALGYTVVVAIELILTETRGAWLAATLGVLIVCALLARRVALAAVVAVTVAAVLIPPVNARLSDLVPDPGAPRAESSFAWRTAQWERLLPAAAASPVLGGGPGESLRLTGKEAHNDYVKALIETGLLGLGIYLAMLAAMLAASFQAVRRVRGRVFTDEPGAAPPLVVATVVGIAAYSVTVILSASGDNLIDNVTFLWSTLPLLAIAQWAAGARRNRLVL